jgi:alanyl-tRNA synthetase
MKTSREIRQDFIVFFQKHQHEFVPSSSVVPHDDPTLLFTNAGMNQFKDVFLETGTRSYKRAVNSQKCIRVSGKHNDLEEVGHDTYHHTFFEMLGNWSFGDYFKKEAIEWGWALLTEVWKLPKDKLWATVFAGDEKDNLEADEDAEKMWKDNTDINRDQVLRFGKKDNFWEMGETGPCGPCSEIHIDLGEGHCDKKGKKDHLCKINGDCARFIELWNLVFIQFNRDSTSKLHPLPAKHVDTGMGFERIVAVLQKVNSNYNTDLFKPILARIGEITKLDYHKLKAEQGTAFNVIADHIRMLTFSITDGALPSNEGRGYVLRRILRRAARYARKLEMRDPFIYQLVPTVVEVMGEAFPEITDKSKYVMEVIKSEEENFNKTLDRGLEIFEGIVKKMKTQKQSQVSGHDAFRLYDTYGFPLDLTRVMAEERDFTIDEAGFETEMTKQRNRARTAGRFSAAETDSEKWQIVNPSENASKFRGYDTLELETQIQKYAVVNYHYHIVLTKTPFYAESGGQVGDQGIIQGSNFQLKVIDTQKAGQDIIHICSDGQSINFEAQNVKAIVDSSLRNPTMANHTATHLLHAALRKVLGDHVRQAGSLVAPDHLRFDFTHFKKVEHDQLLEIEKIVNQKIQQNLPLEIKITGFENAKKLGAMALFGEKYGEEVRMITIDSFSRELCGGTHVKQTGEIGLFVIIEESSIASGVRRIEALTGPKAVKYLQQSRDILKRLDEILNMPADELAYRVKEMQNKIKELERENQKLQAEQIFKHIDDYLGQAKKLGNISLIIEEFNDQSLDTLKQLGDRLRNKAKLTVGFIINRAEDRLNFVCIVTDDLIKQKNLKAGDLVKEAAKIAGGGGGGRPHLATAGAKNTNKLPEIKKYLEEKLLNL